MNFNRSDKNITGKYSEALAMSAFLAHGYEVALPYGNQASWDLLVREHGEWKRVQVKTASRGTLGGISVSLKRSSQKGYSRDEVDYVVAVLPETGTIWKVPIAEVENIGSITCKDSSLWVTAGLKSLPKPIHKLRTCKDRRALANCRIPETRPDFINPKNWGMLQMYASGLTSTQIASKVSLRADAVRDSVARSMKYLPKIDGTPHLPPRAAIINRSTLRERAAAVVVPSNRPDTISEDTWTILKEFLSGDSYLKIAKARQLDPSTVHERIERAVKKLPKCVSEI